MSKQPTGPSSMSSAFLPTAVCAKHPDTVLKLVQVTPAVQVLACWLCVSPRIGARRRKGLQRYQGGGGEGQTRSVATLTPKVKPRASGNPGWARRGRTALSKACERTRHEMCFSLSCRCACHPRAARRT